MTAILARSGPDRTAVGSSAPPGAFREGLRAMLPVLVGLAPYGFVIGVTVAESSVPSLAGWAASWLIYGGSAQLAAIRLLDAGASVLVVVAATVALNARLLAYGAGLAPHWREAPRPWRAFAAYLIVDPSYALATTRYTRPATAAARRWYYLGAALTLWVGWQVVTAAGVVVGAGVPENLSLEFAAPLCLVGLVVPQATDRGRLLAAAVAAAVSLVAVAMPLQLGVLAGALVGVLAGSAHRASVHRGGAR